MDYHILVFTLTVLVISLIPGLNVLFVISQSVQGGLRSSTTSILGIITGNLIYLGISILGLGVIIAQFPEVFKVIKYGGVAFTLYNALKLVKAGLQQTEPTANTQVVRNEKQFLQGVLTIVSNPKAFIFWITILPTFVRTENNVLFYVGLFGIVAIMIDTFVLVLYGYVASKAATMIQSPSRNIQFLISGVILGVVGVWLFFS
jgi:homoserine/homoserine lactone efflux protein